MARKYKLGDKWSEDFDYDGMVEYGRTIDTKTSEKTIEKYADSLEDVNYHTLAKPLFDLEVAMSGDKEKIKRHFLVNFRRTLSKQLVEFGDEPLSTDEIYFFAKGGMTSKMYYIVYNEENGEKSYAEVPATSEKEAIEKLKKEGGVERIVSVRKMDNDEFAKGGEIDGRYLVSLDGRNDLWRGNNYDEAYDEFINERSKYLYKMDVILIDTLNDETLDYYDAQEDREQDDNFAKGGKVSDKRQYMAEFMADLMPDDYMEALGGKEVPTFEDGVEWELENRIKTDADAEYYGEKYESSYITGKEYAKGGSLRRTNNSPLLRYTNYEDGWRLNLLILNPLRNQNGLRYKGNYKYGISRQGPGTKQEVWQFETLKEANKKYDELIELGKTYSKIKNKGKNAQHYAKGGVVFYDIYDDETNKTLLIKAHSLEEAEGIAETLDWDSEVDGNRIDVLDEIANYEAMEEYAKGGEVKDKKRYDIDEYSSHSSRTTETEYVESTNDFDELVKKITKRARDKKIPHIEIYYKDSFIGSINDRDNYKFRIGRGFDNNPLESKNLSINKQRYKDSSITSS